MIKELLELESSIENDAELTANYKTFFGEKIDQLKQKIKEYEKIIKSRYPQFQRSKKFKEFDNFIFIFKWSFKLCSKIKDLS